MPSPIRAEFPPEYWADRAEEKRIRERDQDLQAANLRKQSAQALGTFYTTRGVNSVEKAVQGTLDYIVEWVKMVNKVEENDYAQSLRLNAPNARVERDWEFFANMTQENQEADRDREHRINDVISRNAEQRLENDLMNHPEDLPNARRLLRTT